MNEYWLGVVPIIQIAVMLVGAFFYMAGGRKNKWLRRYIVPVLSAGAVIIGAVFLHIFSWWMLLLIPAFAVNYLIGYGARDPIPPSLTLFKDQLKFGLIQRLIKRSKYALIGITLPGIVMVSILGMPAAWIIPIHIACGALTVYLGARNPIHAASEELIRYILLTLPVILYTLVV